MATNDSAPPRTAMHERRSARSRDIRFYGPDLTRAVGRRERAVREAREATLSLTRLVAEAVDAGVRPDEIVGRTDLSPRAVAALLELARQRLKRAKLVAA
jgi:hypothetical protein